QWLRTFPQKPGATYLVHGEPAASSQLRDIMSKELGWNVQVAQWMQKVEVKWASECRPPASDFTRLVPTLGRNLLARRSEHAYYRPHSRHRHHCGNSAGCV